MTTTADAAARSTEGFIAENPTSIAVIRTQRVKTAAGGLRKVKLPDPMPPVTVRMVSNGNPSTRLDEDGSQVLPSYTVVAPPGSDIEVWDTFQWNGKSYKVVWINEAPAWALRAEVIERG